MSASDNPISNAHDKFFREMFSRQEVAHDFIQNYLPPTIVRQFDLSRLTIRKDSFVDANLRDQFSDILYEVGLIGKESAYVYLLFDHKSYADTLVGLQLLKYKTEIWFMFLKQRRADETQKNKPLKLPPIFPLVVYHGEEGWTVSRQFSDLFDVPPGMEPYLPDYEYWVCDLSDHSDEEIIGEALLQICLRTLKYSRSTKIEAQLVEIFKLFVELSDQTTALEILYVVLRYLSGSSGQVTRDMLNQAIETAFEEGGNQMATLAEQWLAEGEERGRKQAAQEMWELVFNNIRRTLAIRFETPLQRYDEQLQQRPLPTLKHLNDLAFEAATLAEFEAALTQGESDTLTV